MSTRKTTSTAAKSVVRKPALKQAKQPATSRTAATKRPAATKAAKKTGVGKKLVAPRRKRSVDVPGASKKVYPTGVPQRLFGTSNYDPIAEDDDFTYRVTYALQQPDGRLLRMYVASTAERMGAYFLTQSPTGRRVFEVNTLEAMQDYLKNYRKKSSRHGDWDWPVPVLNPTMFQVVCRTFREGRETVEPVTEEGAKKPGSISNNTRVSYGLVSLDGRVLYWHRVHLKNELEFATVIQPEGSVEGDVVEPVDLPSLEELKEYVAKYSKLHRSLLTQLRIKSRASLVNPAKCLVIRRTTTVTEELV